MRTNKGKPSGQYIGEVGHWKIYQVGDDRYKLCASEPVNGKANYGFAIDGGTFDTHAGLDIAKLRQERPELYESVEKFFKGSAVIPSAAPAAQPTDDADPYGDLALSRRRTLTPEQNWKRGLLHMRRIEMEHMAAKKESVWESAVRMLWAGAFKTKIDDTTAQQALAWITQHQGGVNLSTLLQIEQDYYAGKYAPNSCATLEAQLDLLAGNDEQSKEENDNGSELGSSTAKQNDFGSGKHGVRLGLFDIGREPEAASGGTVHSNAADPLADFQ